MLRSLFFKAGLAVVAGLVFAFSYKHFTSPYRKPDHRSYATCRGETSFSKFSIHPHFFINREFLSNDPTEVEIQYLVEKHVRHLYTILPTYKAETTPKYAVVPYDGVHTSGIKVTKAEYPLELKIDSTDIHPKFLRNMKSAADLDARYILKALEKGQTSLKDNALRIEYQADLEFITCEETGKFANHFYLPLDPFLGYWLVPLEKRITMHNTFLKKDSLITPCATPEYLYDQDPYYYWFYWSLDAPTCKDALVAGGVIEYEPQVHEKKSTEVPAEKAFDLSFLSKVGDRPLEMTVAMTLIEDDSVISKQNFDEPLRQKIETALAQDDFSHAKDKFKELDIYDIALQTGLVYVWSLKQMSSEFEFKQVQLHDMLLEWKIQGRFAKSKKSYSVDLVIGSAMADTPSFESFYKVLNQGIVASDIVYFRGHSGAGKNLSKNRIDQQISVQNTAEKIQSPQHQLVALVSCYSLRYFPKEIFPILGTSFTRDILYTASVPQDYDSRMLVGLMEQVDLQLAEGHHIPYEKWPESFSRDVMLVHKTSTSP
jgi:hypothetical protein